MSSHKKGLDAAVSSLVRAASGAPTTIPDKDLELYVANMIAQEAKEKDILAKEKGIAAYSLFERKKRLPKPNMRFLNNLVQQTDSHNYDLILQENKRSRELLEDIERRKASSSRDYRRQSRNRSRSKSRSRSRSLSRERYRRDDDRERGSHGISKDRRERDGNERRDERRGRRADSPEERRRSRSPERKRRPSQSPDQLVRRSSRSPSQPERLHSKERLYSQERRPKSRSPHRKRSPSPVEPIPRSRSLSPLSKGPPIHSSDAQTDSFRVSSLTTRQIRGRGAVLTSSSRLDKFFGDPTYDPRLDMDNYDDTNLDHFVNAIEEAELAVAGEKRKRKEAKEKKKDKKSKKAKKKKEKKEKKRREEEEEGEVSDSSSE